jgi:hypothetical protein
MRIYPAAKYLFKIAEKTCLPKCSGIILPKKLGKTKNMKKLTAAEEQIMQTLWSLGEGGFMKDILEPWPIPNRIIIPWVLC